MTDWKIYLVALLILLGAIFGTYIWTKSATDRDWEGRIQDSTADTLITLYQQELAIAQAGLDSAQAQLGKAKGQIKNKAKMVAFYKNMVDSLMALEEEDWFDWPTATLDAPLKTFTVVNGERTNIEMNVHTQFRFSDLTFQGTRVAITPFSVPVKERIITKYVMEPAPAEGIVRGVWLDARAFKQYKGEFFSSDLMIFTVGVSGEFNLGSESILEATPFRVNWSKHLPEYGFSLGVRKKL